MVVGFDVGTLDGDLDGVLDGDLVGVAAPFTTLSMAKVNSKANKFVILELFKQKKKNKISYCMKTKLSSSPTESKFNYGLITDPNRPPDRKYWEII